MRSPPRSTARGNGARRLRLLCVQDDIATTSCTMLRGAMQRTCASAIRGCLPPMSGRSSMRGAKQSRRPCRAMAQAVSALLRCRSRRNRARGIFVAPTLIDLDRIGATTARAKCSGPILHVRAVPRGRARRAHRRHQRGRLWPHARHPQPYRRNGATSSRSHPRGQRLRQPQHHRSGRRRAALRRRRLVGHRTEGGRPQLSRPSRARCAAADSTRLASTRCPGRPAKPTRSHCIRAAVSRASPATAAERSAQVELANRSAILRSTR